MKYISDINLMNYHIEQPHIAKGSLQWFPVGTNPRKGNERVYHINGLDIVLPRGGASGGYSPPSGNPPAGKI